MKWMLVLLVLATPAFAQPTNPSEGKAKAREFFRTATQHYDLGEFPQALNDFKEAYRLYEEPIFLFNVGQCHRQMGQKEQAIRFFKVYLSKSPSAPNRSDVREMISKLELALDQERKAQTGRPLGTLSPPDTKPEVLAAKPEPKPQPKPQLKPEAKPEAKPEVKAEAKPAPPPPSVTQPAPVATTTVVERKAETPVYKKWWLWTAVAVVVVAGVGIGLGVGLSSSANNPTATTDFGTYKPF